MSLSITISSTREFRRLATYWNTATKLFDNKVGSTGSRYLSNHLGSVEGIASSSSITHYCMYEYNASVFSNIVISPPPIGNLAVYLYLYYFPPSLCTAFLRNFGKWLAFTSSLVWDLMLVDYHLLQFHNAVRFTSVTRAILYLWDFDW